MPDRVAASPGNWTQLLKHLLRGDQLAPHRTRLAALLAVLARDRRVLAIRLGSAVDDARPEIDLAIEVHPEQWRDLWEDRRLLVGKVQQELEHRWGPSLTEAFYKVRYADGLTLNLTCHRGFTPERPGQTTLWDRVTLPGGL